jgi:hypothetical protein
VADAAGDAGVAPGGDGVLWWSREGDGCGLQEIGTELAGRHDAADDFCGDAVRWFGHVRLFLLKFGCFEMLCELTN